MVNPVPCHRALPALFASMRPLVPVPLRAYSGAYTNTMPQPARGVAAPFPDAVQLLFDAAFRRG